MSTDQKPSRMRLQVASLPEIAANDVDADGPSAVAVVSKDTSIAPVTAVPVPSLVVVLAIAMAAGAGAGVTFGFLL